MGPFAPLECLTVAFCGQNDLADQEVAAVDPFAPSTTYDGPEFSLGLQVCANRCLHGLGGATIFNSIALNHSVRDAVDGPRWRNLAVLQRVRRQGRDVPREAADA